MLTYFLFVINCKKKEVKIVFDFVRYGVDYIPGLKPHLMGAQCRCSADEFLVVAVGVHVWGAGGQDQKLDPAAEEEQHEAASSEGAHDPQSDEDPTALLGHEPEGIQTIII